MSLTVLSIAYPLAPVGPDAVGGAEQILTLLEQTLVQKGHRSIVVACEGSQTAGTLVATPLPEGPLSDQVHQWVHEQHRKSIEYALERWPVDVIHMHGIDFHAYLPPPGVPTLVTLHLPPDWYPPEGFMLERPHTYLHCVSASQRRACPPGTPLLPDIENGVPAEVLDGRYRKRNYTVTMGRVCPEKGFHIAIEAAHRAGCPLLLAGQVFPYEAHERYFREEIVPRLDRSRRFIGPVGFWGKRRLLGGARCLFIPSLAQETSSLVAMEALACGTPVVAFPSGALADVIEDGRTGFLVTDEQEMADAIERVAELEPEACRETARRRFSLTRMTEQYLETYDMLAQQTRPTASQATQGGVHDRAV